jgi:hypothetical protein
MLTCSGDYPKVCAPESRSPPTLQGPQFQIQPIPIGISNRSRPAEPRMPLAISCLRGHHALFPGQQ